MKATDLMIGDWVKCHYNENEWVTKVSSIYPDTIWVEDTEEFEGMELCEGQFEPIPLTPEILEKNGFGYVEESYEAKHFHLGSKNHCENPELHIGMAKMGFWLNYYANSIFNIIYVHELQHALRLCGIDKEIVL